MGAAKRVELLVCRRVGWLAAAALKDGASFGDVALATVVAQNPIMADAHQARRQQVQAEAANELPERECQRFNNPALSVIAIGEGDAPSLLIDAGDAPVAQRDRKSTRLNSSHRTISYAVFCL